MGIFTEEEKDESELIAEQYITPFLELNDVATTGFLNIIPDYHDGIIRKAMTSFEYGDTTAESFPIEIYKAYCKSTGVDFTETIDNIPTDNFNRYYIDYVGTADSYTVLSL